jgi:predicted RNase H-like nuclease (RuvC/YqgF family)
MLEKSNLSIAKNEIKILSDQINEKLFKIEEKDKDIEYYKNNYILIKKENIKNNDEIMKLNQEINHLQQQQQLQINNQLKQDNNIEKLKEELKEYKNEIAKLNHENKNPQNNLNSTAYITETTDFSDIESLSESSDYSTNDSFYFDNEKKSYKCFDSQNGLFNISSLSQKKNPFSKCEIYGCRGIGNTNPNCDRHTSKDSCPFQIKNNKVRILN